MAVPRYWSGVLRRCLSLPSANGPERFVYQRVQCNIVVGIIEQRFHVLAGTVFRLEHIERIPRNAPDRLTRRVEPLESRRSDFVVRETLVLHELFDSGQTVVGIALLAQLRPPGVPLRLQRGQPLFLLPLGFLGVPLRLISRQICPE